MIPQDEWKWFGYPGHFICAARCQFRMCTQVGSYLISTVGDYRPDGVDGERETIGAGKESFFETYVFKAGPTCTVEGCGCDMPELEEACEIDGERSATAGESKDAHMRYCHKYAKDQP